MDDRFKQKPDSVISMEISPETIVGSEGDEKLGVIVDGGVKRLSIGVQTFNDNI